MSPERKRCPRCGASLDHHFENCDNFGVVWHCGSSDSLNGFEQSVRCEIRERELAAAEAAKGK